MIITKKGNKTLDRLPIDRVRNIDNIRQKLPYAETIMQDITLLTAEQIAEAFSCNPETILLWVRQGRFPEPDIRQKRFSRWKYETVKQWINNQKTESNENNNA